MEKNEFYRCLRCGWGWVTRLAKKPIRCTRCRSMRWQDISAPAPRNDGKKGPDMKYPDVANLEVGKEVFVTWMRPDGTVDDHMRRNAAISIARYGKRHEMKFSIRGHARGIFVYRRA